MAHRVAGRWKSKFARFIESYGVESLAAELDIRPSAIYHWIKGTTAPKPVHAEAIGRLSGESGRRLTMDDVYRHFLNLREGESWMASSQDDGDPRERIRARRGNVAPL
jgi:hypothetical protein